MSDFDSLRGDFAAAFEAIEHSGEATTRAIASIFEEQRRLWADNAELRDELHAVANRLENLTRAITTEPAEVAQMVVNHELRRREQEERFRG